MPRFVLRGSLVAFLLLAATTPVAAKGNVGEPAPEFAPGAFSDGRHYHVADFAGKLVVLYFFEPQ